MWTKWGSGCELSAEEVTEYNRFGRLNAKFDFKPYQIIMEEERNGDFQVGNVGVGGAVGRGSRLQEGY